MPLEKKLLEYGEKLVDPLLAVKLLDVGSSYIFLCIFILFLQNKVSFFDI